MPERGSDAPTSAAIMTGYHPVNRSRICRRGWTPYPDSRNKPDCAQPEEGRDRQEAPSIPATQPLASRREICRDAQVSLPPSRPDHLSRFSMLPRSAV